MGHEYVKENETFNTSQNGVVPKPTAQDITNNKFLRADGSWASGAGGSVVSVDQVITTGTEIGGVTVDDVRTPLFAPLPKHNFSTTEQVIGTWIDGKPIYEISKEYQITSSLSNGTFDVWDLGTGITLMPDGLQVMMVNATTVKAYPLPYADSSFTNYYYDNGKVKVKVNNDSWGTNYKLYMTARYTKITD